MSRPSASSSRTLALLEPLSTSHVVRMDGALSSPPPDEPPPTPRNTIHAATKLRVRRHHERRLLRRSVLLLVVNVIAMIVQAVCLDVAVRRDASGHLTLYHFGTIVDYFFVELGLTVLSWLILANYYECRWYTYVKFDLLPRSPSTGLEAVHAPPFWRSHLLKSFLMEALVLAVQPIPWLHDVWTYEGLALLIFTRLYLAVRTVRDWAQVQAQHEALAVLAIQEGRPSVPFTCRLALKVLYSQRPCVLLIVVFAVSYLVLIFAFHVTERDVKSTFEDYNNCAWFIITARSRITSRNSQANFRQCHTV